MALPDLLLKPKLPPKPPTCIDITTLTTSTGSFTHEILISKSATMKPNKRAITFNLSLTRTADDTITIALTAALGPDQSTDATINGELTLAPAPFGTTDATLIYTTTTSTRHNPANHATTSPPNLPALPLATSLLNHLLNLLPALHLLFKRYDEVDKATYVQERGEWRLGERASTRREHDDVYETRDARRETRDA